MRWFLRWLLGKHQRRHIIRKLNLTDCILKDKKWKKR